jgi:uncharacterized protein
MQIIKVCRSFPFIHLDGSRVAGVVLLCFGMAISAEVSGDDLDSPVGDYEVRVQEVKIRMPDGVRLHACLSMPVAKREGEKFPPLLSMDPYSGNCGGDRRWYQAYAQAGYVNAYVHVRGTGLSEGVYPNREYSEEELQDAVYLIDWLSRQPWSNGNVGMYGASWSGFNSLQVAMRNPPALKAIVPHVATEDIYHEDVHYADGIFRFDEYNSLADIRLVHTPEPADPLDEQTLKNRFDQPPWSLKYLRQQRDGEFWRIDLRLDRNPQGLKVPALMIGGWYDGYRNSILRALENLRTPTRAIIGPWDHGTEYPQPTAGLAREAIRWWDHWLKGIDNGVTNDPQLYAYLRRPYIPRATTAAVPGEWHAVQKWPPQGQERKRLYMGKSRELLEKAGEPGTHELRYVPSGGAQAGIWWGDSMPDQRAADIHSLVFESKPVVDELRLLGAPKVVLRASATAPHANWVVRLEDVAPDGTVTLITGAGINGTHRDSSTKPEPLIPGVYYTLEIPLHFTSWIFEPGHRARVAVSNGLFPMFWPTPHAMLTSLEVGGEPGVSYLSLPVLTADPKDVAQAAADAVGSRNLTVEQAASVEADEGFGSSWIGPAHVERNELSGTTRVWYRHESSSGMGFDQVEYLVSDDDPANVLMRAASMIARPWQGSIIEWHGETTVRSDEELFHYRHHRQLRKDGDVIREKTWQEEVPRDFQ